MDFCDDSGFLAHGEVGRGWRTLTIARDVALRRSPCLSTKHLDSLSSRLLAARLA